MRLIGAVWVDPLGEKKPPLKAVRLKVFLRLEYAQTSRPPVRAEKKKNPNRKN